MPLRKLPGHLVDQRPLNGAETVHVLDLDDWRLGDPSSRFRSPVTRNVKVDVGIDPQAPLLHVAIADAEIHQQQLQFVEPSPRLLRRTQIGLGDNFAQRGACPIEIDARVAGAGALVVHALAGVLLEVDADDPHFSRPSPLGIDHFQLPISGERQVELADLVALGEVGIEIILPVPLRERCDVAIEGQGGTDCQVEGPAVHDRQRTGEPKTGGADLSVGRGAELR